MKVNNKFLIVEKFDDLVSFHEAVDVFQIDFEPTPLHLFRFQHINLLWNHIIPHSFDSLCINIPNHSFVLVPILKNLLNQIQIFWRFIQKNSLLRFDVFDNFISKFVKILDFDICDAIWELEQTVEEPIVAEKSFYC